MVMKIISFYWLLLQNRPNMRTLLRRRMNEFGFIPQKQETLRHLFFRCSFAKLLAMYWGPSTLLAQAGQSYLSHKKSYQAAFCNGNNNHYVL
jgi:hypothetical protein